MKFKIGLVATLLIGSVSIADASERPVLSSFAKIAGEITQGNEKLKSSWINRAQDNGFLKKALSGIQEYVNATHPENVEESESLILALISTRYITNNKWPSSNNYIGNTVWINNNLIELNRVELGSVNFPTVRVNTTIQHDMSEQHRVITGQRLSSTLMRSGLPPIGPDGKPIKLCRLIKHPKASFFELSESESSTFITASQSGMSDFQACVLYSGAMKKYWPKRLEDFYNDNNVIIKQHL